MKWTVREIANGRVDQVVDQVVAHIGFLRFMAAGWKRKAKEAQRISEHNAVRARGASDAMQKLQFRVGQLNRRDARIDQLKEDLREVDEILVYSDAELKLAHPALAAHLQRVTEKATKRLEDAK